MHESNHVNAFVNSLDGTRLEVIGQELGGPGARADIAAEFVTDDGVRVPVCIEVFKGQTMQGATRFGLGLRARRHFPIVLAQARLETKSNQRRPEGEGGQRPEAKWTGAVKPLNRKFNPLCKVYFSMPDLVVRYLVWSHPFLLVEPLECDVTHSHSSWYSCADECTARRHYSASDHQSVMVDYSRKDSREIPNQTNH